MLVVITLTPAAATTAITIKTMVAMAGDTPRLSFNKFLFFVFIFFIFTSYLFCQVMVIVPASEAGHRNHHAKYLRDALYRSCLNTIGRGTKDINQAESI
jgi:hypothetical protein